MQVRDGKLVLKSKGTVPFKSVPKFLAQQRADLKPEDIQVVPVDDEIRITPQLIPVAEFLAKAALSLISPKVEPVEGTQIFRVGRGTLIAGADEKSVVVTYVRMTDRERPEFMRSIWFLRPARALALARRILEEVKNRDFTYMITDSLMLMRTAGNPVFVNIQRSLNFRPNETELELLKAALEGYLIAGELTGTGNAIGRIRITPDGLQIAGSSVNLPLEKAYVLEKLL